jgi:hypothetical protein
MKKAWETYEAGRAQKAMKARQKFLDSLQPKVEERPSSGVADSTTKRSESRVDGETTSGTAAVPVAPTTEQPQVTKQIPPVSVSPTKKNAPSTTSKKGAAKDDAAKQAELAAAQELAPPPPLVDEPLLNQPPPTKPKIILPPIDVKPFIK